MRPTEARAVVLRVTPWRDSDLIVDLLTDCAGRL
ncbi:MAG: recombination protein O N-terminal domain-containing protein, partial [Myxococcales bacterium]|nr:recombination protein O N-terminal domain-containing protein [Myxococcales bacterium]